MNKPMTLDRAVEFMDEVGRGMISGRISEWPGLREACGVVAAHLAQPAQAVDVGAGSAHKDEDPVKLARAVCEAVIKHQFQDKNRHGRLTLDVQTFLRELNVARDSGLTRALSGEKAGPVGGRSEALKLIAAASESYEVPAHLTPSKAEYVKAGARSFFMHLNATLAASPAPDKEG